MYHFKIRAIFYPENVLLVIVIDIKLNISKRKFAPFVYSGANFVLMQS